MDLNKLLKASSIAIVGATDKEGSLGARLCGYVLGCSIADSVYLVNPKKETLFGRPCYPRLDRLPIIPDCAAICLNSRQTPEILKQAGQLGIRSAVIYASGFREEGTEEGVAREEQLKQIAADYDMAVLGPNCGGFINCCDRIVGFMLSMTKTDTGTCGISVISQSGGMAANIYNNPCTNISYAISIGNASIVTLEDCMEYVLEEETTNVLALYIEGVQNPARFEKALKKAALLRKPVIILKGGRSVKGAAATSSHTGSMAGSAAVFEAVAKRYGAILVRSENELQTMAIALGSLHGNFPQGKGLVSLGISGACATLCADLCGDTGINLAEFSGETQKKLKKLMHLPQVCNPLDGSPALLDDIDYYAKVIMAAGGGSECDTVMVTTGDFIDPEVLSITTLNAIRRARELGFQKPIILLPGKEGTRDYNMWSELDRLQCPMVLAGSDGYQMIRHMLDFFAYDAGAHTLDCAVWTGRQTFENRSILSEWESKEILRKAGFPVPKQSLAGSREALAEELVHYRYPVVLKVCSRDIPHKTEAGGVKLNLKSKAEALDAFDEIMENCRAYCPDAVIDGVILSGMAGKGTEMILGVKNDETFGPMLLTGLGGIFTDLFHDSVLSPCPVNQEEARQMLLSLKGYRLLTGYRGSALCDIPYVVDQMVRLSEFAAGHRDELLELDINPLAVYEKGAVILDALLCVRGEEEQ